MKLDFFRSGIWICACFAAPLAGAAPSKNTAPAIRLPGLLQAEAFDEQGLQGATSPEAKSGRVRIHGTTAVELRKGEGPRYTVEVSKSGMYTFEFRTARTFPENSPHFRLTCDGADVTGTLFAPYTEGLLSWTTLLRPAVNLTKGRHVFQLELTGTTPLFLDWIKVTPGTLPTPGPRPDPSRWELIWSDEFDADGRPDPNKWTYDLGGHGWGNRELQCYTDRPENARVEKGRLLLEVRAEKFDKNDYTSARLVTRGKQTFRYGRVEVSAKLPAALGTWPAIWMLGDRSKHWPECGEIDIMEHVACNPGWIHGSTHSLKYYFKNGNQKTSICYIPDATTAFHDYAIEWYPDRIDFFVDNNPYLTVRNDGTGSASWPFDAPEFLLLNVALGGWGGPVDDAQLPARMEVDYVRVYRTK